jgi:acyl-CoA thioesterase-2
VGDLGRDTAVEPSGDGRFTAQLSEEWEIWGPMGGYVAAIALRAAGCGNAFARPASLFCHYLGVAKFGRVEISVETRRSARSALAQRVEISQEGRPILDAAVWSTALGDGLEHHLAVPPDVVGPDALPSMEELRPGEPSFFPFWDNLESRPVEFEAGWPPDGPRPPVWQSWSRFRPTATFADPWIDAARSVVLLDVQSWPAASRHHAWREHSFIAPSLDLYTAFHEPAPDSEWLLADGHAPTAGDGLFGWTGRVWSSKRRLVASGGGQALFRPAPGPR